MQIRILAIGDICAVSAQRCLAKIAKCDGVEITCGVITMPEADLIDHSDALLGDLPVYRFDYCADGSVRLNSEENCSFSYVLSAYDWDYIAINRRIENAGLIEGYFPYINNIADFINEKYPRARLVINEPWAFSENSGETARMIRECCIAVAENTRINIVFPVGEVWETVRQTYPDIELSGDGIRSGRLGDFLSGAVWYEVLTGNNVAKNSYRVPFVNGADVEKLKVVVHEVTEKYTLR